MQTRRRGQELETTILDAAWAEIQEHGYARLTMEGVAARARTGKQVVYRRWPNRAQLTVAAIRHVKGSVVAVVPDTGSLREDLAQVFRRMAARVSDYPPDLLYGLLADMPSLEPEFFGILPGVVRQILDQAVARGEITHADLPPRVVSLPIDLLGYDGLRAAAGWPGTDMPDRDMEKHIAEILDDVFLPLVKALTAG